MEGRPVDGGAVPRDGVLVFTPSALLTPLAARVALVYLAAAAVELAAAPSMACQRSASSAVAAAWMAALALRHRRRSFAEDQVRRAYGLLGAVCTAGCTAHLVLAGGVGEVAYMVVALVAVAALQEQVRWLLVADAVCLGGVALAHARHLTAEDTLQCVIIVLLSAAVAHVMQAAMNRIRAELRRLTRQLTRQALHDDLTGLLNRRGLVTALTEPCVGAEPELVTVLVVDVDGFKGVNDGLGHAAGDEVLVAVADGLRAVAGPRALVARTGGDEFTVVLPGSDEEAERSLRRRAAAELQGSAGVLELPWAVSTGSAAGALDTCDVAGSLQGLLARADIAMYEDKRRRRDAGVVRLPRQGGAGADARADRAPAGPGPA